MRAPKMGSRCPALRAIPFPEVTERFCRLPSSTLLYRPEAANLGDLMRLWVRPDVRMMLSFGISGAIGSIPDASKNETLDQMVHPISR